ncbi:MAG: LysM domain protein [Ignavibacteria bacterium]|nr:LysM domain protein [Ignavibacteria bacterium]
MKKILFLIVIFALTFSFAKAQVLLPPESKPDEELKQDEAELRIKDWQAKIADLESRLKSLNENIVDLTNKLTDYKKKLQDCNQELARLIGATAADIDAFRQKLGVLEGKVRDMKKLPNDELADRKEEVQALENELNTLRTIKIAAMPEFYNRIIDLAREIKGLYRERNIKQYTVKSWFENKDCLWNIAGRLEMLGDPFLWPKIWQANTNLVRNPDIIHPGQVLIIPAKAPKTTDELKAERKYWRQKRAAMEEPVNQGAPTTKKGE